LAVAALRRRERKALHVATDSWKLIRLSTRLSI